MLEFIKFAVKKKKSVCGARGGGQGGGVQKNKNRALDACTKRLSGNTALHNEVVNHILL